VRRAGEPCGRAERQKPERERLRDDARPDDRQAARTPEEDPVRDDVPGDRSDAERREQPAGDARVGVEAGDDEHRDADEEGRPCRVTEGEERRPQAQQRLAREEADAAADADVLVRHRLGSRSGDEQHEDHDRDGVRAGVDHEHPRRRDRGDQDAAEHGAEQHRAPRRALEERVRASHERLVLPEQLGHDHLLRGEVRAGERAEQECQPDDRRERIVAEPVEERDREHERRPDRVGEPHRLPRAESSQHRPAGDSERREPDQLGADDRAHPGRRAGRHEHEPREGEPRHLRPGRRDDLGREQGDERPTPEQGPLVWR